jgi:hypothetical protein
MARPAWARRIVAGARCGWSDRASATHGPGGGIAEWPLRSGNEFPCHDEHLGRFGGSPRVIGVPDSRIRTVDRRPPRRPSPRRPRRDVGCLGPSQRWNGGNFVDPKVGKELLSDDATLWLSTRLVRGRPLSPRTLELYRWQLRKHILPTLGKTQLRHLGTTEVRRWFARINGPDGPGQPTAAKCYRLLRAIMQTATEDGRVAKNPCSIRSAGREEPVERPMITLEQLDAITAAAGERWRSLIEMAAWCGLHFGELAALRKSRTTPR